MTQTRLRFGITTIALCAWVVGSGHAQTAPAPSAWVLHPYVDASATWDSNIMNASEGKQDDTYLDGTLGLQLGYATVNADCNGRAFLGTRKYADLSEQDFSTGGELLRFKHGTQDPFRICADQSFRRLEDVDRYGNEFAVGSVSPASILDSSSRARRDINQFGISADSEVTDKTTLQLGYKHDAINYAPDDIIDMTGDSVQMDTAYRVAVRTAMLLSLKTETQNRDEGDGANYYAARLGARTHGTDKLVIRASAGVQQFDNPSGNGTEDTLSYDLSAQWAVSAKTSLQAGCRNGAVVSSVYADNAAQYDVAWLGGEYRPIPVLAFSLRSAYRTDDYMEPIAVSGGTADRKDTGIANRLRADYCTPSTRLRLYAELLAETTESSLADDYDKMRINTGATVQY